MVKPSKNETFSSLPRWTIPAVLIGVWLIVAGIGGPYFGRISEVSSVDLAAFLPSNAEATKVKNELKKFQDASTIPAIVVFTPKDGMIDQTEQDEINRARDSLRTVKGVSGDVSPVIMADDSKAAMLVVQTDTSQKVVDVLTSIKDKLNAVKLSGVTYKITGPAGFAGDLTKAFAGIDGVLLMTALAVVFVILVVVYRSALLPIIVLLTSMFALAASILLVWTFAKLGVIQLNGQVQGILFILVIGAATDYSLLYISRYREELYRQASKLLATRAALQGSFEPIIASGSTVIVGLLCLLLSDLASNRALGPVGATGIVMAMTAALTFLPAVLYFFGRTSFWPMQIHSDEASRRQHEAKLRHGLWQAVGLFVAKHPRAIWLTSACVLAILSIGYLQLRADGVDQSKLVTSASEARDGQELLVKHFPAGSGSPLLIVSDLPHYERVVSELDSDGGIDGVSAFALNSSSGNMPLGKQAETIRQKIRDEVQKTYDQKMAEARAQLTDVEALYGSDAVTAMIEQSQAGMPTVDDIAKDAYPFKDAVIKTVDDEVILQATLVDTPDSQAAKKTVDRIRELIKNVDPHALVGGPSAVQLDTLTAAQHDRFVIIPVILLAITIILMVLLRSIIAPLLLLLTTVLSFSASLGVAALMFNHVWKFPGVDPTIILYGFVFLVALGIDYNIFLMTRVREESLKLGTQQGVIKGLVVTGGVITSAGIVLAATFAALAVIPILFLVELAFIVAFGVLLDTIIVRSLLVPALIKDIGARVWWPSKLQHKK